jgi:transcriptional regulator with XRE-family HTH domain
VLTTVNIAPMLTFVTITAATMKPPSPATVGAMVRDARLAAGISQSELGKRIGASRFWVAQFERGKPSAELGLALKALHALALDVRVEPRAAATRTRKPQPPKTRSAALPAIDLGRVIADSITGPGERSPAGWPVVPRPRRPGRRS